jgi:hypothetical protein
MSEIKTSEIDRPMNAPGFMRPRQTVLDEPLEFGVTRHTPVTPEPAFQSEPDVMAAPETAVEPDQVDHPAVIEEGDQNEDLIYADMTAEEVLTQSSFEVQAEPAEFAADAATEAEPQPASRRKLTGFQRFILFLLVVFVMLTLATVFLYVTGRIELPDTVIVVIEKGLKLIQ